MRYGMTFCAEVYDFERDEELRLVIMPGDYIRMCNWADAELTGGDGTAADLKRNYAAMWFALSRRGELEALGLPAELSEAALDSMADRFSIFVEDMRDDLLPLAKGRER